MQIKKSRYRELQENAARERYESEKQSNRQKIVETLQRVIDDAKAAQQKAASTEKNKERWERRRFWLDFTAVVAVFIASIFAGGQLAIMSGQLEEMRGTSIQTQQQIAAANRLADNGVLANAGAQSNAADQRNAASKALAVANAQLAETRIEKQPVVTVSEPVLTRRTEPFPTWDVVVNAQNSGIIPTKSAESVFKSDPIVSGGLSGAGVNYSQSPPDPETLFNSAFAMRYSIQNYKVFGSHVPIQVAHTSINENDLSMLGIGTDGSVIMRPAKPYFVYGAIKYTDWLQPKVHLVKFCFVIQAQGVQAAGGVIRPLVEASACHHWNCADEQCRADKSLYDKERMQR